MDCCVDIGEGGISRWKCLAILRPGWVEMLRLVIRASRRERGFSRKRDGV